MTDKAKILFVDDEKRILTSLKMLFRKDYDVFTANSGPEALEIIRREQIHAIISDQRMPDMLGHEVLREVNTISPNTMRLLLTGFSDLTSIVNSINDGEVFRYINKPWNNDEIRQTVASAVQISKNTIGQMASPDQVNTEASAIAAVDQTVLVLDNDRRLYDQVKSVVSAVATVSFADSVDAAISVLERSDVAVLVTDVTIDNDDTTDFVKLLKRQYPQLMTVVMTEDIDADTAVELINQGQVFRYLRRPASDNVLGLTLKQGFRFYARNKHNTVLLQRNQVETNVALRNPSLTERITGRLKSLSLRFSFSAA